MAKKPPRPDPVADAEQALTAAARAEEEARARLADLESRIVAGDLTITADQHGEAEHAVRYAELKRRGAQEAYAEAQREARRASLTALADQYTKTFGSSDEALKAMAAIEDAAAVLVTRVMERNRAIDQATLEMQRAGVPQLEPHGKVRRDALGHTHVPYTEPTAEHGFLGWREPGMGRSASVTIRDRTISVLGPGLLIAAALERACKRAGVHPRHLDTHVDLKNVPEPLVQSPAEWLTDRY